MISVYAYKDFRSFIRDRFAEMPRKGYGQSHRLAKHLGVHTTLVSQIMKGVKVFSLEQAHAACEFLGLDELETDYFVLLVQKEKAGSAHLKNYFEKKLSGLRAHTSELVNRLKSQRGLDEGTRAIFYSHWKYSAARQLTAIPGHASIDAIAGALDLSLKDTKRVMDLLVHHGLCVEKKGKFLIGPSATHLEASSPWTYVNHLNWRQKAMEEYRNDHASKLHYTCPMTLSRADAEKVRAAIVKLLEDVDRILEPSPSEELHCLNIDWFRV